MVIYWELFLGFTRAGILGYGGGPASIPLFYKEAVERYKWVSHEEFGDIVALGNTLPGPIVTKTAGYIGYRVAGILGCLTAVVGTVIPTVLLMVLLLGYLYEIQEASWVKGMTTAIQPVIGVMMFVLAYSFFKDSWKGQGRLLTLLLVAVSVVVLQVLDWHPAILIGALLMYGLLWGGKKPEEKKKEEANP